MGTLPFLFEVPQWANQSSKVPISQLQLGSVLGQTVSVCAATF